MFAPPCLSSKTNVNFVRKLLPIPHSSLIRHDHNVMLLKKFVNRRSEETLPHPKDLTRFTKCSYRYQVTPCYCSKRTNNKEQNYIDLSCLGVHSKYQVRQKTTIDFLKSISYQDNGDCCSSGFAYQAQCNVFHRMKEEAWNRILSGTVIQSHMIQSTYTIYSKDSSLL